MNEEKPDNKYNYVQEETHSKTIFDYIEDRLATKELKYSLEFQYLREWLLKLEKSIQSSASSAKETKE